MVVVVAKGDEAEEDGDVGEPGRGRTEVKSGEVFCHTNPPDPEPDPDPDPLAWRE